MNNLMKTGNPPSYKRSLGVETGIPVTPRQLQLVIGGWGHWIKELFKPLCILWLLQCYGTHMDPCKLKHRLLSQRGPDTWAQLNTKPSFPNEDWEASLQDDVLYSKIKITDKNQKTFA